MFNTNEVEIIILDHARFELFIRLKLNTPYGDTFKCPMT